MHSVSIEKIANSLKYSDRRHPVDIIEPLPDENRDAADVIARVLVWVVQGRTLRDRGYRATVAVFCLRKHALDERTLEDVGESNGYSRQAVNQLVESFKEAFNYDL
ncbi:MAG: hypothetical protein QM790_18865 [Nibricoccus sp.]